METRKPTSPQLRFDQVAVIVKSVRVYGAQQDNTTSSRPAFLWVTAKVSRGRLETRAHYSDICVKSGNCLRAVAKPVQPPQT